MGELGMNWVLMQVDSFPDLNKKEVENFKVSFALDVMRESDSSAFRWSESTN